ncbi:MAG: hypothetical protein ACTHOR_17800 [Devosia sp.]
MTRDPVADALAIAKKPHTGPIMSAVGGRTDAHAIDVPNESFVLPADVVSGVGEGNTLNGMKVWMNTLGMTEHTPSKADGTVPIMAAGGELVVPPEIVAKVGGGDLKKGHVILRHAVLAARKHNIKTLKKLKEPHR